MKRGREPEFLYHEGQFVGINLSADYAAEHEWGIRGIRQKLGIPDGPTRECLGFDARKVTRYPDHNLRYEYEGGVERLALSSYFFEGKAPDVGKMRYGAQEALMTAWSGDEFAIESSQADCEGFLGQLFDAFVAMNIVVFLGESGPFHNGGLKICIADRLPKESIEEAREKDLDYIELKEAAKATGIYDRIDRSKYFALSPAWANGFNSTKDGKVETEHEVMFWLNPANQREFNYGWYTVEQLDQWLEGKGPILKKSAT